MQTTLVSDIFGVTPALLTLKEALGAVHIVDPYDGQCMNFNNEAEAYAFFSTTVGLDQYYETLVKRVKSLHCQTTLIGFSVGAAAIWRLASSNKYPMVEQAFCFYGSQIRNFPQIDPCFKTHLIFPKKESHFEVRKLIEILSKKQNTLITQTEYLHGFMNRYSANFSQSGYKQYLLYLNSLLNKSLNHREIID